MEFSKIQSAVEVPFDNTSNGFNAEDVQAAIEEVSDSVQTSASPGFSFGRSGNVSSGTWLQNEGVPSNRAGRWVYINNAEVTAVFVANENVSTFSLEVYYHDGGGVNLTLIGTVNVVAAYGNKFPTSFAVPTDKQLAIKLASGSGKNVIAGLELRGTVAP